MALHTFDRAKIHPKITAADITVEKHPSAIVYVTSVYHVCVQFARNESLETTW